MRALVREMSESMLKMSWSSEDLSSQENAGSAMLVLLCKDDKCCAEKLRGCRRSARVCLDRVY